MNMATKSEPELLPVSSNTKSDRKYLPLPVFKPEPSGIFHHEQSVIRTIPKEDSATIFHDTERSIITSPQETTLSEDSKPSTEAKESEQDTNPTSNLTEIMSPPMEYVEPQPQDTPDLTQEAASSIHSAHPTILTTASTDPIGANTKTTNLPPRPVTKIIVKKKKNVTNHKTNVNVVHVHTTQVNAPKSEDPPIATPFAPNTESDTANITNTLNANDDNMNMATESEPEILPVSSNTKPDRDNLPLPVFKPEPSGIFHHEQSMIRTIPKEDSVAIFHDTEHPQETTPSEDSKPSTEAKESEQDTNPTPNLTEIVSPPTYLQNEYVEPQPQDTQDLTRDVLIWSSKIIAAARRGDYDSVVHLLSSKSVTENPQAYDVNCLCVNGYSPLQWAVLRNHHMIVEYMLRQYCADHSDLFRSMVLAKSSFGSTALHLATSKGNLEMVQLIVEAAAAAGTTTELIDCQNEAGWTSLHYASNFGFLDILEYLANRSSPESLYIVDEDGETLLHRTCYHSGHRSVVQFIVECDNKNHHEPRDIYDQLIHRLSYKGETAFDIAFKSKHNDVADYLLSAMTSQSSLAIETIPLDRSVTLVAPGTFRYNDSDDKEIYKPSTDGIQLPFDQSVTLALPSGTVTTEARKASTLTMEEVGQWNDLFMSVLETGDLDTIKLCIDTECIDFEQTKKLDDDGDDNDEFTALHLACIYNHYEVLKYLIEGAGMNATTKTSHHGSTILHIAARNGSDAILHYLVDNFLVDVESTDNYGKTALHCASRMGLLDIVTYLMEFGRADYVSKDENGYNALQLACRYGHLNVTQYIMQRYNVDNASTSSMTRDSDVHNAFWLAGRYGQFPIVKFLVQDAGMNVDMKHNSDGMTALLFACQYGAIQYVRFFCEDCNADIHVLDKLGDSALDKAKKYGHKEVAAYISEQYKHVSQLAEQLRDHAKFGRLNGLIDSVRNNHRVNINAGGSTGKTALHYSTANGHYEIAQFLVQECGANVNQRTVDGATPLHYACRYGHLKCVQFLRSYEGSVPVDENILDNQGETALAKAKKYGHNDIVAFLENATTGYADKFIISTTHKLDPVQLCTAVNEELKCQWMGDGESEPIIVHAESVVPLHMETSNSLKSKPDPSSIQINALPIVQVRVGTFANIFFLIRDS